MADDRRACAPGEKGKKKAGVSSNIGGAVDRAREEVKRVGLDYVRGYRVTCKGVGKVWSAGGPAQHRQRTGWSEVKNKVRERLCGRPDFSTIAKCHATEKRV